MLLQTAHVVCMDPIITAMGRTTAVPRPPSIPDVVPDALVVDIVTAASNNGWGWSARTHPGGDELIRLHERRRSGGVIPRIAAEIGDWLRSLPGDQIVTIRCFTSIVREALVPRLDPVRFALPDGLSLGPAAPWAERSRHNLVAQLDTQEETLRRSRVLYGGSDGAIHPSYGNGAWAWVDHLGEYEVGRGPRNILLCELTGILQFAKQISFTKYGKAVLFVDSLRAISALRNQASILWRLTDQHAMLQTVSMVRAKRLELVWVRGHTGHAMNDVADRLALMRHRAVRMQFDEATIRRSAQGIVDGERDTLAGTRWSKVHEEALKDYHRLVTVHGVDRYGLPPRAS
jgi:ribonuclease HI